MKTFIITIGITLMTAISHNLFSQDRKASPAPVNPPASAIPASADQSNSNNRVTQQDTVKTKTPQRSTNQNGQVDPKLAVSDEGVPADKSGKSNKRTTKKPAQTKKPAAAVSPK